jgi:hypothetical protein
MTIDQVYFKAFQRFGHDASDWASSMISARRVTLPAVKHDRLRAAAEFRLEIARRRSVGGYYRTAA